MRVRVVVLVACAAAVLISGSRARGQQQESAQPVFEPLPTVSAERAAAFVEAAERGLDYLPGEVLVKFKDGVSVDQEQRALSVSRGRPSVDRLEWAGDVAILRDPSEPDARALAERLSAQPEVTYAEPNYIRHHFSTPNDTGFAAGRQWNFTAIDLPRAWDINPGGKSDIIVAVVDTGVTTVNQTFTTRTWNGSAIQNFDAVFSVNPDLPSSRLVSPVDLVSGFGTTVLDSDGHGTHVSSTIGEETNNALLDAGIAYNARIMPVKVCLSYWDVQFSRSVNGIPGFAPIDSGGCPTSAVGQGIRYAADNGAKVINLSLGGSSPSQTENDAITYAVSKGAFVSIAAGNEFLTGNAIEYPAFYASSISGAMAVGATNRSGNRAYYSNTGSYVEIAAPGGDSRDSDASGSGFIWQSTIRPSVSDPAVVTFPRFDAYAEVGYSGTSMATPHVAGLAALLYSQGITSPAAIEAAIKKSAKFLGTPTSADKTRSDEFGAGIIQARAALFGMGVKK